MGLFDGSREPGADIFHPCPNCGQDSIYSKSQGLLDGTRYLCDSCGYEAYRSEVKKSFVEFMQEATSEKSTNQAISNEFLDELASNAKSATVTPSRLSGGESYFENVLPFLEADEQPHFLFPLTKGLFAKPALIVDSGAEREEFLTKHDGGSLIVSDICVRIIGTKGDWTIPYSSITTVDFVGHPSLHIHTEGRTYYINVAGTHFDLESTLADASDFIRKKQRQANSSTPAEGTNQEERRPIKQIEELNELKDRGIITEEEFQIKKKELLDKL